MFRIDNRLFQIVLLSLVSALPSMTYAQTCMVMCADGSRPVVDCNWTVSPCHSGGGSHVPPMPPLPPPPDPAVIAFQNASARFEALVQSMPDVLDPDAWLNAARSNEDELSTLLDDVHGVLFNHLFDLQTQDTFMRRQFNTLSSQLGTIPQEINDEQSVVNTLRERDLSLSSIVNLQNDQISKITDASVLLTSKDGELKSSTDGIKANLMHWFEVVLPSEDVLITPDALAQQYQPNLSSAYPVDPGPPLEPAPLPPPPPVAAPLPVAVVRPDVPSLDGTLADKLTQLETFEPQFEILKSDIADLNTRTNQVMAQLNPSEDVLIGLKDTEISLQASINRNTERFSQLQDQLERANQTLGAVSGSLYYHVAEGWLWQTLKTYVVAPEIQRIVAGISTGQSQIELTDSVVDDFFAAGKQHIFSAPAQWTQAAYVAQVQNQILVILDHSESFASQAATVAALGTPEEMQALSNQISAGMSADTDRLAKSSLAGCSLPEPLNTIARRVLGIAPNSSPNSEADSENE